MQPTLLSLSDYLVLFQSTWTQSEYSNILSQITGFYLVSAGLVSRFLIS